MNKKIPLLDYELLFPLFLLIAISIVNLYSAAMAGHTVSPIFYRQILWFSIGIIAMFVFAYIDYRVFKKLSLVLYIITLFLILLTIVKGRTAYGAQRWLSIGFLSFQPSEIAKFSILLVLSNYFDEHWFERGYDFKTLITPLLYILIPFVLIIKQPDLGTAIIVLLIGASIILFVGIRFRTFLLFLFAFITIIPLGWHFMKGYQKARLIAFVDPYKDPLGSGYHLLQSRIAVGSGKLFGVGYLKGTQSHLNFLPESHTDFIFSVLAEEWGFVGCIVLIAIFVFIIVEGFRISHYAKDRFGSLLAFGITISIFLQFFINIGMSTGILPVVGITLPLMSYGGSSILMFMIEIGILLSVNMRRFRFEEV
ncbi:MAG: rod shape-determining protein RodA [bacterium]